MHTAQECATVYWRVNESEITARALGQSQGEQLEQQTSIDFGYANDRLRLIQQRSPSSTLQDAQAPFPPVDNARNQWYHRDSPV